jgi:hypothetical protein
LVRIGEDFRPEPDVAVIDSDYLPDQRFVERAYLLAEVVSRSCSGLRHPIRPRNDDFTA